MTFERFLLWMFNRKEKEVAGTINFGIIDSSKKNPKINKKEFLFNLL
jgi:hypothetical protein